MDHVIPWIVKPVYSLLIDKKAYKKLGYISIDHYSSKEKDNYFIGQLTKLNKLLHYKKVDSMYKTKVTIAPTDQKRTQEIVRDLCNKGYFRLSIMLTFKDSRDQEEVINRLTVKEQLDLPNNCRIIYYKKGSELLSKGQILISTKDTFLAQ